MKDEQTGSIIKKKELSLLFGFFVLSIFIRALFWMRNSPLYIEDLYNYQSLAKAFLERDWKHFWHFHFYPFFPTLVSIVHLLTKISLEHSTRILSLLFGSLTVFPLWFLAKEGFSKKAGLFACLTFSLGWEEINVSGHSESLLVFLIYLAISICILSDDVYWILSSFFILGLASLTKSEGWFFFVFTFFYLLFFKERPFKLKLGLAIACIAIFLITVSPVGFASLHYYGHFRLNPKPKPLFLIHNPPNGDYHSFLYSLREDENGNLYSYADMVYHKGVLDPIPLNIRQILKENYLVFAKGYFEKFVYFFKENLPWLFYMAFPLLLPVVPIKQIMGIAGALFFFISIAKKPSGYKKPRIAYTLFLLFLFQIATVSFYRPWSRFFYSIFPIIVIFIGDGISSFTNYLEKTNLKERKSLSFIVSLLVVVWLFSANIFLLIKAKPDLVQIKEFEAKKELAHWLRPRLSKDDKIITRGLPNHFGFFLGIPFWKVVPMPYAPSEKVIRYAFQERIKWILLEEKDLKGNEIDSGFANWFKPGFELEGIRQEKLSISPYGYNYVLYRVVLPN